VKTGRRFFVRVASEPNDESDRPAGEVESALIGPLLQEVHSFDGPHVAQVAANANV
jgi:hypothetical protein